MTPIDFGGGMIFPSRYGRDQPDGPDPCDECDGRGFVPAGGEPFPPGTPPDRTCPACGGTGQVG